ncbi:SDR family oxidoreductase [Actinomadura sp. SCN-SB]|uniref:SDR family oxidoreductase n=1 Tax=Actinomadura sp. SCN-SB TaxID=3373092 RepID=UPI003753D81D
MKVLITGGASGLGAAIARRVADDGGTPLIVDRHPPKNEAGTHNGDIAHMQADLADRQSAERAVHGLAREAGGLDAVVTAAGIDSCGRLGDVPAEDWDRVVQVNLLGTAAVVRAALPYLEHAPNGRIVTCASTLGLRALSDATAYCASKFGVVGFSRALAAELAGHIGVTTLVPGGMDTAFFDGRDERYRPGPDARLNKPSDVAAAVAFALSQPPGCEVRELVVCPSTEPSWP